MARGDADARAAFPAEVAMVRGAGDLRAACAARVVCRAALRRRANRPFSRGVVPVAGVVRKLLLCRGTDRDHPAAARAAYALPADARFPPDLSAAVRDPGRPALRARCAGAGMGLCGAAAGYVRRNVLRTARPVPGDAAYRVAGPRYREPMGARLRMDK